MVRHNHPFFGVSRLLPSPQIVLFRAALEILLTSVFAATSARMAEVLQPFVDNHTLAGAVTLVASKDKAVAAFGR